MSSTLVILLIPYYVPKMIAFGLFGLSMIKYVLSMVSACEFVHSRDKSFVCSVLNYYDALTPAISGIFFILVKHDIFPLYFILVASSVVALLTILIFNLETPRWLLHNGRT